MRDVTFTIYRNAQDVAGQPLTWQWERWVDLFSRHEVRGSPGDTDNKAALDRAKNGPAIVLGEIPLGKSRRSAHVRAVHALAIDVEHQPEDRVAKVLGRLEAFEWCMWTTHKHGSQVAKGYPRLRVVLPLAEPLAPSDHRNAWSGLNYLVEGINDPATRDIGRLHFLPSTYNNDVAWSLRHSGRWLKIEDLPDIDEVDTASSIYDGMIQQEALEKLQNQIRCIFSDDPVKGASKALLKGEPLAAEGHRHNTILELTWWIARRNDSLTGKSLEILFRPSIEAMEKVGQAAPTMQDVLAAYSGAVEKVKLLNKGYELEKEKQARQAQIDKAAPGQGPYTNEDLERIAKSNGWGVEQLGDKWIVQRDGAAWFLTELGEYAGPYSKEDVSLAASKYLARAPVRLVETTRSGFKYRPIPEVVRESGSLADKIVSDMTVQRTSYDSRTRVMREAISILRTEELAPEFNAEFDGWMKVAGGHLYEKLVDWVACCPDLNKLLCAIYFDGGPSSGKTLFAHGLAKMWTDGPPADIEAVLSDFNDEIARCPLVIADEEIPKRWNRATVTTTLRSMLSTVSRTLKRKYKPTSEVRGAVRLVLTANNEFLLDNRDVASSQDLEAIAQRFLYVAVPTEAAKLLNDMPRATKEYWGEKGIAKHALWLAENHEVKEPGKRFWVEGDVSQMHRLLMTGSRWNSLCCEWLVRYIMQPEKYDTYNTGLIQTRDGELLVNAQALIDGWDLFLKSKLEPETAKIGAALRAISKTARRRQIRFCGKQIRYNTIDVDYLVSWADRYNIGDRELILKFVEDDLPRGGDNVVQLNQPGPAWNESGIDAEDEEVNGPVPF